MRFYSHYIDHIYHVFALFSEYLRIPFSWYFNYLYRGTLPVLIKKTLYFYTFTIKMSTFFGCITLANAPFPPFNGYL